MYLKRELPKLQLKNVSKTFHTKGVELKVLEDIDLGVEEGEFLCLVGPSGCGKSTLLNIIAGLEEPDSGEIFSNGHKVTGPGTDRVLIFQELALFPWLTVIKNVEFGLKMLKVDRKTREGLALEYLKMVHLSKFKDAYVYQLSGGMKQRVALARALAMDPEILLMDEPFMALDAQTGDLLRDELQHIWKETRKTIIFVTHNVREAVCLGDRVLVFSARPGRIKKELRVEYPRPRHIEDPWLMEIAKPILKELKVEVEKFVREELGNEWISSANHLLRSSDRNLGDGI
ncbi:NitT/TauT family transport system ATP-binding protein [Candidatus Hakubella thermalkaliphila]|uniref:NitT/TauT family transport system ATP-binding protein n=2 Tax=Candidatus Hakubella thermalkaliphila TaxID=2754717 RepID=A0A6V8NNQ0_9ACTN|nr:ABC transporter ATP-binding protein [Candidatus Hakubella thermalkaliphila]GFP21895.1 NitT/TauT family transport system ATP-binding protein [Candidatus Hakubella thermalkaliphila]GFP28405.1 NitT/TauT family transport system ATP-binding protein [Candidatus Hakubella thermalkaliphila]GFP35236.1 NitT/TauT family transport system ATP-binding protein [Candidatus Hakubella thermalkaliphila]